MSVIQEYRGVFENDRDFLISVVLSVRDWGPRNSTSTKATLNQQFSGFGMNLNNEVHGSQRIRYRKHDYYREGEAESCLEAVLLGSEYR